MQTAIDYIKNNFKYSDNMRDFLLYASLTDLYNYNQTEYYIYSYFDLSDTEYYKAEAYFDVFQDNCEYRVQGVDIKIYFPPNIYKF